jgi:hypothetical protein
MTPVRNLSELRSVAGKIKTGEAVVVQVNRGGQMHYVAFELY